MEIPPLVLLNALTYNGLFDWVSLENQPALVEILKANPSPESFHLELTGDQPTLWTIVGWVRECSRREHMTSVERELEFRRNSPAEIKKQIVAAAMRGDVDKVIELQRKLQNAKPIS